ncbi:hypothetical protein [Streptomyces mirabilis]
MCVRVHEDRCVGTTTAHGELVDAQIRDRLRKKKIGEATRIHHNQVMPTSS